MPVRAVPAPTEIPSVASAPSWKEKLHPKYLYSLIADNPGAHFLLISALVIGFFHGWLKMRFPGMRVIVFAYDVPLMAALGLSLLKISKGHSLFPKSRTSSALQLVLAICILYGMLPNEIPLLVRLAAFRGWALVPLTYLMGYHLLKTRDQVYFYGTLILILSVATAVYGARQDPAELRKMAESNATLEMVMKGSFYGDEDGTKFRVFSTFVSAGAFGATMAYSVLIGLARISTPGTSWLNRLVLAGLLVPITYGILLSASRSATIIAAISVLLIAWYRKSLVKFAILPAIVLGVLMMLSSKSGTSSTSRMSAAADPQVLMGRVGIVVRPAFNRLLDNPLGSGLGRSGHGLPSALGYLTARFNWRPVDGDVGRVAVEFGIFGLVAFAAMFIAGTRDSFLWMKQLRGTELDTAAVTAGAMFVTAFISFPTGSPFLAIPMGAIIWFHLGALNRLYDDHAAKHYAPAGLRGTPGQRPAPIVVPAPVQPASGGRRPVQPPRRPTRPPATEVPGITPPEAPGTRPKRFLYQRSDTPPSSRT
jgi:hypothetical protein